MPILAASLDRRRGILRRHPIQVGAGRGFTTSYKVKVPSQGGNGRLKSLAKKTKKPFQPYAKKALRFGKTVAKNAYAAAMPELLALTQDIADGGNIKASIKKRGKSAFSNAKTSAKQTTMEQLQNMMRGQTGSGLRKRGRKTRKNVFL